MFQALFRNMSPVVKNLLIINGIFFLAQLMIPGFTEELSLHYFESSEFKFYQVAAHFFMHGSFIHIFFNMFALVMFGPPLERIWSAQRFLVFYFITAFGAAFLHQLAIYIEIQQLIPLVSEKTVNTIFELDEFGRFEYNSEDAIYGKTLGRLIHSPMLGASGAVYGILAGFAYYFPNTQLMLLFPPIPIKAKYLVLILVGFDLFMGLGSSGSNIAHFAHLGGALFGIVLVLIWQRNKNQFY